MRDSVMICIGTIIWIIGMPICYGLVTKFANDPDEEEFITIFSFFWPATVPYALIYYICEKIIHCVCKAFSLPKHLYCFIHKREKQERKENE